MIERSPIAPRPSIGIGLYSLWRKHQQLQGEQHCGVKRARAFHVELVPRGTPNKFKSKETRLKSTTIEIDRKRFRLELRENQHGRFVRLTESAGHRQSIVIIPVS